MFKRRENEPEYAILTDPVSQQCNRYGNNIETVASDDSRRNQSLNINGDTGIGDNPNRYKQHGFYFNADNCIACHACEAACSEKNDVPGHLAFRSVGFVEGGSYPAYQRINISMACNHCDNPVCLKGCPTRAYTKFAEYGAVLQDPDICFGCGYCTWVCPYNAPQLDPVKGQVSKCNMCVDRLEVGLKPACVSACLGNALDFGVIENIPENRVQAKTSIPGFPDAGITQPNIRFQQLKNTQRDMRRVDNTELKYHRDDKAGIYKPALDPETEKKREWNLRQLFGSHESAHVIFTLSTQAVMGAFLLLLLGNWVHAGWAAILQHPVLQSVLLLTLVIVQTFGLFKLTMHLGKPLRFYRGFNNLRWSPVSREIAGVSLFYAGLLCYALLYFIRLFMPTQSFDLLLTAAGILQQLAGVAALAGIAFGGFYMIKLYRIPARPFWNHWHTNASFVATMMTLGACGIAGFLLVGLVSMNTALLPLQTFSLIVGAGVLLEIVALLAHARTAAQAQSEAALSYYEQTSIYGYNFVLRNSLLVAALVLTAATFFLPSTALFLWPLLILNMVVSNIIGRSLFYVVVIPTTMPGAFFWRNKKFQQHARETGLANMPQVGVLPETH